MKKDISSVNIYGNVELPFLEDLPSVPESITLEDALKSCKDNGKVFVHKGGIINAISSL